MNKMIGASALAASLRSTRMLVAAMIGAFGANAAAADLSGVWQIAGPTTAIKTTDGRTPPLLPQAQRIYEQRLTARKAGDASFDPATQCKPLGEPRIFFEPGTFEILQRPELIAFLFQWNRMVRFVAMDKPQSEPIGPTYFGQSVGKWQGDTLVIDVIGLHATTLLDAAGLPHGADLHLTEYLRLKDRDTLEARIVIDDSKTYSRAWETSTLFKKLPAGARVAEDVCVERLKIAP